MASRFTHPVFLSWYLAVLFVFYWLIFSLIDTVPGDRFVMTGAVVSIQCIPLFVLLALIFKKRLKDKAPSRAFRIGYAAFAGFLTLVFLMLMGG